MQINQVNNSTFNHSSIAIIGLGLIGGSLAKTLRNKGFKGSIVGVETSPTHQQKAIELNLVDEVLSIELAIKKAQIIYIAIPVDATINLVLHLLKIINDNHIIIDGGSTKHALGEAIKFHPKRNQFVASHPMWGTEFSGPEAAVNDAFTGRACVICDKELSNKIALETCENLYAFLGMHLIYMNAQEHDIHAAYVSHISHITSFALANTVLEKERESNTIFELAAGGFESTVRLAKSNPAMWAPIFMQNRENVLDVLNEHISQLRKFKACLEKENYDYLWELMTNANRIKKILK